MNKKMNQYDVVVVGGGMSGICAAIASARGGAKTVLVHNRTVVGGNASSEIRMHIGGADFHSSRSNSRETGILEEILLENKRCNPQKSYSEFDRVLWQKVKFQDNLDLFLNTHVHEVETVKDRVVSVTGIQNTTEKTIHFKGDYFIDTTGDAYIASRSGAKIMYGREDQSKFDEEHAPYVSDDITMGLTLMFTTKDMNKAMPFIKPEWANTYSEEDLYDRGHSKSGSNYWWIELGGHELHTISDGESIRDELLKAVYGVWDHIKNGGDHGADNYVLDWVGFLPGKRESRRVVGDYILTENNLRNTTVFEDVVAYGGWPMDMHAVGGLKNKQEPTEFIDVPEIYGIPYRSLYSKSNSNLFVGGRSISVSRMAFGSTRLMATCAVVGQAIGTAAALCNRSKIELKELDYNILQNKLYMDDAYLPGFVPTANNLAKAAVITSSNNNDNHHLVDGVLRDAYDVCHGWSDKVEDAFIDLKWDSPIKIKEVRLYFDSNLSQQIMISLFSNGNEDQIEGLPYELIKSYDLEYYLKGELVSRNLVKDNHLRLNIHDMVSLQVDQIKVIPFETYGSNKAKIFEIKVF